MRDEDRVESKQHQDQKVEEQSESESNRGFEIERNQREHASDAHQGQTLNDNVLREDCADCGRNQSQKNNLYKSALQ